jgi:hypothetical protein
MQSLLLRRDWGEKFRRCSKDVEESFLSAMVGDHSNRFDQRRSISPGPFSPMLDQNVEAMIRS